VLSCVGPTAPSDGRVCTAQVVPGIVVEIRAKASAQPLAYWAQGVVREGAYSDSLEPYGFLNLDPQSMVSRQAAYERAGIYSVEVTASGFQTVKFEGVTVLSGPCHVQTANLTALLEPAP